MRRMKALREEHGTSQAELAKQVSDEGLPFHQPTIQRIETGARPIRLNEAMVLARVLETSLEEMAAPDTAESMLREVHEASGSLAYTAADNWNLMADLASKLRTKLMETESMLAGFDSKFTQGPSNAVSEGLAEEIHQNLKLARDSFELARATINQWQQVEEENVEAVSRIAAITATWNWAPDA